jgi:probable rRNA maturation factor
MMINRQSSVRVSIAPLKRFLAEVCILLRVPTESVTVCLVTNPMMARWNSRYRAKQAATDVLSFPVARPANGEKRRDMRRRGNPRRTGLSDKRSTRLGRGRAEDFRGDGTHRVAYLGDVAIAPAVARGNARRLGRTLDGEMKILILHGMLHLLGYDHETDHGQMERRERRLRCVLGLN